MKGWRPSRARELWEAKEMWRGGQRAESEEGDSEDEQRGCEILPEGVAAPLQHRPQDHRRHDLRRAAGALRLRQREERVAEMVRRQPGE